jgi:quercetin dioxygenase-like cupin family protein
VQTFDLYSTPLMEVESELEPDFRIRVGFPIQSAAGTASTATVLFELEPGACLARHTDSAEELLFVLAGSGEASVGEETAPVSAGQVALVPAMVPHGVRNTGDSTLRVLGFFSSSTVVSAFERPVAEGGPQLFVVGAPMPLAVPLEEASTIAA